MTTLPDISLLYTRPSARLGGPYPRVDLFIPRPRDGWEGVAYNVLQPYADAIITAINERDQLLDLLADLAGDFPAGIDSNALQAARAYLARHL